MDKNKFSDLPVLEYKGFRGVLEVNKKDNGRIYGKVCPPESPDLPLEPWIYAGDTVKDAQKVFEHQVEKIILHREYAKKQTIWKDITDYESIRAVRNILPELFKQRVEDKTFDLSLLSAVPGGDYQVPLYYITKAWDILLKGSLEPMSFKIGPEEDYDFTEEDLAEFIAEEHATRTRFEACRENNKMKVLWKKLFDIDIDTLQVDFCKFDMHLPPKVSIKEYEAYFVDVIDGVNDWILDCINHPEYQSITFDAVSALMEFTAQVLLWREDKLIYY